MATHKYKEVSNTILELYSKGYTREKIAKSLGMEVQKIAYVLYIVLKVQKDQPRKMSSTNLVESMPKDQVNRIITLSSWGYNMKEIAEDTCLPYNRVQVLIKEATEKNLIKKMI